VRFGRGEEREREEGAEATVENRRPDVFDRQYRSLFPASYYFEEKRGNLTFRVKSKNLHI
jgi:hypothetical protein